VVGGIDSCRIIPPFCIKFLIFKYYSYI
jgi:hypothetical protein